MAFRWPTSRCRTLAELEDRVGELVGQLEPVVLPNQIVETTEKAFTHGLGEVPGWVGWDPPHCISVVRQTRPPTKTCVYLRATVQCVINIRILRAGPLGFGAMRNGGYHLPDWDPAGTATGDHKFATDATDEAEGGAGYALDQLSSEGNVKPTLTTTGGPRKTRFDVTLPTGFPGFYEDIPEPVGVGAPGTSPLASHGDHSHAPGDPIVTGGKLWTAFIPGAVWEACATWAFGYTQPWTPGNGWSEEPPGSGHWVFGFYRSLAEEGLVSSLFDGVVPEVGMRVFAWHLDQGDNARHWGPYVIDKLGGEAEYPEISRAPDADESGDFIAGKCVLVTGGSSAPGHLFKYTGSSNPTLGTDLLVFADQGIVPPPTGDVDAALTAAQLGQASSETVVAAAQNDTLVDLTTVGGILSGQTLTAGQRWEAHLKVKLTADDPAATTQVKVFLASTSGSFVLLAESAALHNEDYATIMFGGVLAADYGIPTGEELRISIRASSDSVGGVEVQFIYNASDHPSFIQTPLTLGFSGTDRHDQLTVASRSLPNQHIADAIGPGRLHRNIGTATDDAGFVTMPSDASQATVELATPYLNGISTTGFTAGDHIWLKVTNPTVGNPKAAIDGAAAPSGFAPLALQAVGGVPKPLKYASPFLLHLMLDVGATQWLLASMPIQYEMPT